MKAETHKVTAFIPKTLLHDAREVTGKGITETLKYALEKVLREQNCKKLKTLYGSYKSSIDLKELREDR